MPRLGRLRRAVRACAPALALGTAGLTVACADMPTAPGGSAPSRGPALALSSATVTTSTTSSSSTSSGSSAVVSSSSGTGGDTSTVMLRIDPTTTATFTVNVHKVQIVAGSICDPSAGYGPTLWDAPCKPAAAAITITAKAWTSPTGRPVITFSPDVRFVPGKVNTIWLLDATAASRQAGVLAWCPTGSGTCVNESLTDPSLVTKYMTSGYAYRRIKHFSGYTVVFN